MNLFRNIRLHVGEFHSSDILTAQRFRSHRIAPHTILLLEPNTAHGEVAAGLTDYLYRLGYQVEVLCHRKVANANPFAAEDHPPNVFGLGYYALSKLALGERIGEYERVILTSSTYYRSLEGKGAALHSFCELWGRLPEGQKSTLVVEHELDNVTRLGEDALLKQGRLLVLSRFDRGIFVNPHRFGSAQKHAKNVTCTTFIIVGSMRGKRRDYSLLFDAVQTAAATKRKFRIVLIGRGRLKKIPAHLRRYFVSKGALNYPDMFSEMRKADYFLPLLNPESPEHHRYITTGVTGSAQLIYGFGTPPLIHKDFAAFYGFDTANAFVYNQNTDFGNAMCAALEESAAQYAARRQQVERTAQEMSRLSLENLQKAMGNESHSLFTGAE